MTPRFTLFAVAFVALAAAPAWAQKPVERSPLEIGQDVVASTVVANNMEVDARTGRPVALYRQHHAVAGATPEAMARAYLADRADLLRIRDLDDLTLVTEHSGQAGHVARFQQTLKGIPVMAPHTVVNMDHARRVQYVLNGYVPLSDLDTTPEVAASAARQAVLAHLGAQGVFQFDQTDLVVYPTEAEARLAWRVRVVPEAPLGDWEAFVDAKRGTLLRVADRSFFHATGGEDDGPGTRPAAIPTVDAARQLAVRRGIDGTGMIFDPDPLSRAGVSYGTPGYVDGSDADTPELTAARTAVTLRDIMFDGSMYHLDGPWAAIREFEAPNKGTFPQASPDWSFTRNADAFEAATTYWHLDNYMRYLNVTLGCTVEPYQYTTGVQFDAHGLNGADNSHYIRSTGRLAFGEGGVDDNEDADVIIHELGHGIHDWLTSGGLSQVNGLSEGTGDFVAASYSRSLGLWASSAPQYNWVFVWDGHNPFWNGRVTNWPNLYPGGLVGQIHTDGQIWSSTLMQIWDAIGGEAIDRAVCEGLRMTNGSTNQQQAAQAVLQAAFNMGYDAGDITTMFDLFAARGYNVTNPVPVELVSFGANVDGGTVELRWGTSSETNNAGFEVQMRAPGAEAFAALGFVEGHGTTTEARAYRFTVSDLTPGTHTFRLKQIDFDGAFEFSPEVEAAVGVVGTHQLGAAYPNPFNPQAQFTLAVGREQQVSVALFDALGRQVATLFEGALPANEARTFTVDGRDLPSGLYVYRVVGETFSDARALVLAK